MKIPTKEQDMWEGKSGTDLVGVLVEFGTEWEVGWVYSLKPAHRGPYKSGKRVCSDKIGNGQQGNDEKSF